MSAVSLDGLWMAYPNAESENGIRVVLEDVSLEIAEGEFVCVLGPSGCGKSTILRIVAGLEKQSLGTVTTKSRPSVVFQEHGIFPWLTVAQNVAYPLKLRGVPKAERRAKVDELLELVGLSDFSKYYPAQISGGMRQRASVARALADDGDVLLMDEPFGALDEQTRVTLQQDLLDIWDRTSKAVMFITHSVDEALLLADRVLVMSTRPGKIIEEVKIPFERPRDLASLRRDPRYAEITAQLWAVLGSDVAEEEVA
ncbi:ABC transporter ATP-binding protein [Leucobacter sp. UT-8R-CII-1-4]|uniref:ABC transporter ATP-binding protein n=1 Tax=Leucobacter sp. UT-8R-CII-1-4 TaxID=3040075 RepID=UPI0024A7BA17|nr:ABC transporter ATP-binding protein [Leucobacter sp. UT-8R-CII-1-4]MDI6023860.1 ABC transporter ATP-binding protein [Leucobacter sp. UT-8R-CII-1-4]